MEKDKRYEEDIELIGVHLEEGRVKIEDILDHDITQEEINSLKEKGIVTIDSGRVRLTQNGSEMYNLIIRRHRLAERLLNDILTIKDESSSEAHACEFEHFLNTDVTESICTLLGHPTTCPHGKFIPPGECCSKKKREIESVVYSLDSLDSGESGRVIYISTHDHSIIDKLSSMGIMPGVNIRIHQKQPAIVILFEETTMSIDTEIAREIYVKKER
ncbi:MAG: FeoA domain-containing protein [Nitrospinae bacterium]|nr:FeoA domain-containing protein [Nitrospinota bacterium]